MDTYPSVRRDAGQVVTGVFKPSLGIVLYLSRTITSDDTGFHRF